MSDLYFSREIDTKYETNINFFAQEPDYQQIISENLTNVFFY